MSIPSAFRDAPAAQRLPKSWKAEFAKRDQDLQRMAKQLQGLQENLEKNSLTMAESDAAPRKRFGELSREFQRRQREFREDLNLRQNEENAAAVIEKANKAIKQLPNRTSTI